MYDECLQADVFADTDARVQAEGCMYVIFHEPTNQYFRHNPTGSQFKVTNAKGLDLTTRYLLCRDYIFHQMTDQTNYVKQTKTQLKQNYDQMTNQRQDFYDPDTVSPI